MLRPAPRWDLTGSTPTTSACGSVHDDLSKWWRVFNDPRLDSLVGYAYRQNLSLRVAACRVLEARAQVAIDTGNLFPQTQTATGGLHAQRA